MSTNILYIVVIYGIRKEQSAAYRSLLTYLPEGERSRNVYIHDNTLHNVYLAQAYNEGFSYAEEHGFSHIVLLDHDTELTEEYLSSLRRAITSAPEAVWVPTLCTARGKRLSPFRRWGMKIAFNSGMLIPVTAIRKIGGFNTAYPLDYLDHWVCYRFHQEEIALRTLPVRLTHALSVSDYRHVPQWRYLSLLRAEKQFAQDIGRTGEYKIRLLGRLIKWTLTRHPYIRETRDALLSND